MRAYKLILISCLLITTTAVFGQQKKLAQTGMKFLSVSSDARGAAMGDALTSLEGGSSAMFFNPASMAEMEDMVSVSLGQTNWIAEINHIYGSLAFSPNGGNLGVFGLFFQSVDYGDMMGTIIADNEQGFIETGTFSPSAMAVGIGYAKSLSEKFSIGGNVKYVFQDLGTGLIGLSPTAGRTIVNAKANVIAFDFGVLYHTGFRSLNFGMNIRNFSQEAKFVKEGFELPLTFKVSLSMNMMDLFDVNQEMHRLNVALDAVHPRDYDQQINLGAEYIFMNTLALRAGFSTPNDEHNFTTGVGIQQRIAGVMLAANYGYTPYTVFDPVHRITLQFGF